MVEQYHHQKKQFSLLIQYTTHTPTGFRTLACIYRILACHSLPSCHHGAVPHHHGPGVPVAHKPSGAHLDTLLLPTLFSACFACVRLADQQNSAPRVLPCFVEKASLEPVVGPSGLALAVLDPILRRPLPVTICCVSNFGNMTRLYELHKNFAIPQWRSSTRFLIRRRIIASAHPACGATVSPFPSSTTSASGVYPVINIRTARSEDITRQNPGPPTTSTGR
ncbi:hypothetical protein V1504DRAFT_10429 [Lipomyces starkeyi]